MLFRQYAARQAKTFKKVKLDAIAMLGKNIFLLIKFKKAMGVRRQATTLTTHVLIVHRGESSE